MKKRVLVITIVVIAIALVGMGYLIFSGSKAQITQGELSQRAKEHIDSKRLGQDDAVWRNVNFDKKRQSEEELRGQYLTFDGCYRINVPFGVTKEEERGDCVYALFLVSGGMLALSYSASNATGVHEASGVLLRRSKKEEYLERKDTYGNHTFTIFKKIASDYESSAFSLVNGHMLTISLTSPSNEDFDAKFQQILYSIEVM